jgi:preprotein translocase subunit YajC
MENFLESVLTSSIVFIVFVLVALVFLFIRSQRGMKNQKAELRNVHQNLKPGARISFANGLFGTVAKVGDEIIEVKTKSGAILEVNKFAISAMIDNSQTRKEAANA